MSEKVMEKIAALCRHRGFIFPGSEIYGGLANTWDYGPLGVELKNNVKRAWWKKFVQESPYNVGCDTAILMNPKTWVASGHVGNFNDPLVDCRECKTRHRADKLIEEQCLARGKTLSLDGKSFAELSDLLASEGIVCPNCAQRNFTEIRQFNLMFKTSQGVTETSASEIYLRPETAQGIFVNFRSIMRSMRKKLPFGICQIGKSFRNEITPGNFIFRTREFEQMELEFFCKPGEDMHWFEYWRNFCHDWLTGLGLRRENLRLRDHSPEELSHYSRATTDFEYRFPFGWGELWGIANRTDYDLRQHMEHSGEDFNYIEDESEGGDRYIPYCIEPSLGADRVTLAFLTDAYREEDLDNGDSRTVLHLHPFLAPYKAAILPLSKKLAGPARAIFTDLSRQFMVDYDEAGSIGRRYRRHDEIGTPLAITYDFQSGEDGCVTVRDRDTMAQQRVAIGDLSGYIAEKVAY
ncbi:MAG: glycine--tRNA ligase [Negativicutes bacterium]|nr:glycine--tRNA ligase [Negativicutes bacterium]